MANPLLSLANLSLADGTRNLSHGANDLPAQLQGRRVVVLPPLSFEKQLLQLIKTSLASINSGLPEVLVSVVAAYVPAIENQLASALRDPNELTSTIKQDFIEVLKRKPELFTKKVVLQICQVLYGQKLLDPNQGKLENYQLLSDLADRLVANNRELFNQLSDLEYACVLQVYQAKSTKSVLMKIMEARLDQHSETTGVFKDVVAPFPETEESYPSAASFSSEVELCAHGSFS